MNVYYWLSNTLSFGYTCLMPLLIIGWLIFKKYRCKIVQFVAITNGWFVISTLLTVIDFLLFSNQISSSKNLDEGLYYSSSNMFTPNRILYWVSNIGKTLAGLLFISKKFRYSISISFFVLLMFVLGSEIFILYFSSTFYKDYLPSSWAYYYQPQWLQKSTQLFVYSILIAATYFLQKKIKSRIA